MFAALQQELDAREAQGLLRRRRTLETQQSPHIVVDGKPYLAFCSNDYLGLASHPELVAALQRGAAEWGAGAGAAHLVSGHFSPHEQLETELAAFVGKPAALLFSTGYMANLGVVQALVGKGDTVFADKLNHASLNDAMLLSRAEVKRYRHNDIAHLAQLLEQTNGQARFPHPNPLPEGEGTNASLRESPVKCGRKLVITDAVFSMDGDIAPLPELLALCEQHDAWLLVDDAHGFGVLGEAGRGTLFHRAWTLDETEKGEDLGKREGSREKGSLTPSPSPGGRGEPFPLPSSPFSRNPRILYMATLGKAAGVFGAFVAAEPVVIATLVNAARSYVYTTATPPALSVALLESLKLVRGGDARRDHLRALIARLKQGLQGLPWTPMASDTAIQPLLVGDNQAALELSLALRERGIWVAAIRPPTVPAGTARLRITLSAAHTEADVDRLLEALHDIARESDRARRAALASSPAGRGLR